jgi:hypothetical protein
VRQYERMLSSLFIIVCVVVSCSSKVFATPPKLPHKTEIIFTLKTKSKITVKVEAVSFDELESLTAWIRETLDPKLSEFSHD